MHRRGEDQHGILRTASDIGGTFTDVAAFDEATGRLYFGKSRTTPGHLVDGILTAAQRAGAALDASTMLVHGSTVVINALLERKGANTALITTMGFRDVYEIGRINRPDSFNLRFKKHAPLVVRAARHEVKERIDAQGDVVTPFDEAGARALARRLAVDGTESVAVLFLHSYNNPMHEEQMRRILGEEAPDVSVSLSHEVSREYREYERTSTVVANAYVRPKVSIYIDELASKSRLAGFAGSLVVLQSNGGLYGPDLARSQSIEMLESGPAAGVTGANALCEAQGIPDAITFDMGGTTAKACVIESGVPRVASDYFVGGYFDGLAVRIPGLDIKEVGTGGGSIARVDEQGRLHLGPESAGADPGPACYGKGGTFATVTDADLILGRLDPTDNLAGEGALDTALARDAMRHEIASPLGISVARAALGISRIAAAKMSDAVRAVTSERGLDPRDFVMIAYGGGGPVHVADVARELGMRKVLIPPAPSVFSALGMLLADLRRDYVRTLFVRLESADFGLLESLFQEIEADGTKYLESMDVPTKCYDSYRAADMRYLGQEHSVTVDVPGSLTSSNSADTMKAAFDAAHDLRYGHSASDEPAEIVSLRVSVVGRLEKPGLPTIAHGSSAPHESARLRPRQCFSESAGAFVDYPAFRRSALLANNVITGPALIGEEGTCTVIHTGDRATVDGMGCLLIEVGLDA